MDKITTIIDGNSSKEFVKGTFILDYVALGIGGLCILLYIIFGFAGHNNWLSGLQLILLSVGILLIVLAIALLSTLNKAIKKGDEFKRTITYEFEVDYLIYEVSRNEEIIENGKLPYTDFTEYKETENYVYVGLKNNTWFAIKKVDGLVAYLQSKGLTKFKAVRVNKKK